MKIIATAVAGLLLGSAALPAIAQSTPGSTPAPATVANPGKIETARKLVVVLKLEQRYDEMFKPLVPMMVSGVLPAMAKDGTLPQSVRDELQTDKGKARIGRIVGEEFVAAFRRRYPLLEEETAKQYAAAFTEDELQSILAFYSSGTGAKALQVMPQLSAQLQSYGGEVGRQAGKDAYEHILDRLDGSRGT